MKTSGAEEYDAPCKCFLPMQASDFLERLDDSGRPILSENFTALLSYANGAHERPVCLEGVSYLEKVISCSCACAATPASQSQMTSQSALCRSPTANSCMPHYKPN